MKFESTKEPSLDRIDKESAEKKENGSIEKLEELSFPIEDKIELLLTWKELKKADDISIETKSWKEDEQPKHIDSKYVEQLENVIKDMNLFYTISPKQIVDSEYFYKTKDGQEKLEKIEEVVFYIAKRKENLDLLMKAIETEDDKLLGQLYGFPDSAVNAYLKGEGQTLDTNLSSEIEKQGNISFDKFAFARFNLSKNNWQEELGTSEKWANEVKKTSPKLYNEYIEFMKGVLE